MNLICLPRCFPNTWVLLKSEWAEPRCKREGQIVLNTVELRSKVIQGDIVKDILSFSKRETPISLSQNFTKNLAITTLFLNMFISILKVDILLCLGNF